MTSSLSSITAPLAFQNKMPEMVNAQETRNSGFADVSNFSLETSTIAFTKWLVETSSSSSSSIDNGNVGIIDEYQALKFLTHMIRTMGLSVEDLIYMRIFIHRSLASSSTQEEEERKTPSFGLLLLLSAYCSQSLQYDEPLSKDTWKLYSRMEWSDFLDTLFTFTASFGMDLSVSIEQWNSVAFSLFNSTTTSSSSSITSPATSSPATVPSSRNNVIHLKMKKKMSNGVSSGGINKKINNNKHQETVKNVAALTGSGYFVVDMNNNKASSHSPRVPSSAH